VTTSSRSNRERKQKAGVKGKEEYSKRSESAGLGARMVVGLEDIRVESQQVQISGE
jgi:hypothetical protein